MPTATVTPHLLTLRKSCSSHTSSLKDAQHSILKKQQRSVAVFVPVPLVPTSPYLILFVTRAPDSLTVSACVCVGNQVRTKRRQLLQDLEMYTTALPLLVHEISEMVSTQQTKSFLQFSNSRCHQTTHFSDVPFHISLPRQRPRRTLGQTALRYSSSFSL